MGTTHRVSLSPEALHELEQGYRNSNNPTFSRRCHIVLLKSEKCTSTEVATIVGSSEISVNTWLDRYEKEGIEGLKARPGRGRKPILDQAKDKEVVRRAVQAERQRLTKAKEVLAEELNKEFSLKTLQRFFKKCKCHWKRIRLRPKGKPDAVLYALRTEALGLIESQSETGNINLFYGDETQISEQGYVPYGWQFEDEDLYIKAYKGGLIHYLGLLSRDNRLIYKTTQASITANSALQSLDEFSFTLDKPTVLVLDNARVHTAHKIKERLAVWQNREVYIFYLPPYSPQLNIIERFWKELKQAWIKPEDHASSDSLFYALDRMLANVGKEHFLKFNPFNG